MEAVTSRKLAKVARHARHRRGVVAEDTKVGRKTLGLQFVERIRDRVDSRLVITSLASGLVGRRGS